jgi:hypothetical protein
VTALGIGNRGRSGPSAPRWTAPTTVHPQPGCPAPILAGVGHEPDAFDVLASRLEGGPTEQSMIATGRRGVGKTDLLGRARPRATVRLEAIAAAPGANGQPCQMWMWG